MKLAKSGRHAVNWLVWLLMAAISVCPLLGEGVQVETQFDVLKTRTGTYSNVTVTAVHKDWIFILYTGGMGNVKISDLPYDAKQKLGILTEADTPPTTPDLATMVKARELPKSDFDAAVPERPPKAPEAVQPTAPKSSIQVRETVEKYNQLISAKILEAKSNPNLYRIVIGSELLVFLFVSYCCWLICRKTHMAPGILVWLPLLQSLPLLRAADMPLVWFFAYASCMLPALLHVVKVPEILISLLALLILGLNVTGWIIWSIKIVKARGKNVVVAVLLIFPLTAPFAFLYLAFSSDSPIEVRSAPDLVAAESS